MYVDQDKETIFFIYIYTTKDEDHGRKYNQS